MDRQRKLAVVLTVLVVGWALWFLLLRLRQSEEGGTLFGFSPSGQVVEAPALAALEIGALERRPGGYSPGRDPFRFYVPPAPPPPRPTPRPAPRPATRPAQPNAAARAAARRPPAPTPPAVDVTYLGSFGPESNMIAVFTDGQDIYNVQKGGILKDHFVVDSINYESADLKYVKFPQLPPKRLAAGG